MQKIVELRKIGTKLQTISVFSVEHAKGFIFIEADKEHDVREVLNMPCIVMWNIVLPI